MTTIYIINQNSNNIINKNQNIYIYNIITTLYNNVSSLLLLFSFRTHTHTHTHNVQEYSTIHVDTRFGGPCLV